MGLLERVEALAAELAEQGPGVIRRHLGRSYFGYTPGESEMGAADRIGDLADDLGRALPGAQWSLTDLEETDEGVRAVLSLSGAHDGELWGAPPSGNTVEWSAPLTLKSVEDGLAIRFDDPSPPQVLGVLRQLELINPPDEMDKPLRHPTVVIPDFVLKVTFTGQAGDVPCSHLDLIAVPDPTSDVCEQCLASGDVWPALRQCLMCGFVGCCDTSKNRHAKAHHAETGHPLFRSLRGDESWMWCYDDEAFFEGTVLARHRGS